MPNVCLTREQLERLLQEELTEVERLPLENHVEICPACQAALDQLAAALPGAAFWPAGSTEVLNLSGRDQEFLERIKKAPPTNSAEPALSQQDDQTTEWPEIPGYTIQGVLGRGGTGTVYKAMQLALHRPVALKIIDVFTSSTPDGQPRFRVEAELVARLQHPNIVQIYEVGTHGRQPFLVLEMVEGRSLADWLQGQPLPPPQAAELIETLA